MSIWTDISEKVETGSKIVADKARELSQIASLRAQIVACDNVAYKNYRELGKAYFEDHKEELEPEYAETMKNIADSLAKKADLQAKLNELKETSDISDVDLASYEEEEAADTDNEEKEIFDEIDEDLEDIEDKLFTEEE